MGGKKILVGVFVVAFLFTLLFYKVDARLLGSVLADIQGDLLALGLVTQLLIMWIKSVRWALTIRSVSGCEVQYAFVSSMIGFAGNVLLPARLGELARVNVIEKHNHIGRSLALTTLGVNQLFDLLVLVSYFLALSSWTASLFVAYRLTMILLGMLLLVILGSLVVLQRKPHSMQSVFFPAYEMLPGFLERRLRRYTQLFVQGLGILNKGQIVSQILFLTIVIWSLETVSTFWVLQAFRINATPLMAALLVVATSLSFAFPITPGNVGIAQAICVVLLGAFGVTTETALAYSIGSQGATYLMIVTIGMICFYRERMSLDSLQNAVTK